MLARRRFENCGTLRGYSEVGDYVVKKFYWMSDGKNTCEEKHYSDGKYCMMEKCAHSSVSCLAGTGDFRIGESSVSCGMCSQFDRYEGQTRSKKCNHLFGCDHAGIFDSKSDNGWHIREDGFANATGYGGMCRQLEAAPFRYASNSLVSDQSRRITRLLLLEGATCDHEEG
eukprot:1329064-Pyramimonas_sp.AAC.1